jgi:hypothetical protein
VSGITTLGLGDAGTTGGDPNFRLDIGSVLSRTFSVWAKSFVPFFLVGFVVYVPVLMLIGLLGATQSFTPGTERLVDLVTNLFSLALTGAVTFGVFRQLHGKPAEAGEALRTGLSKFGSVWITAILVGLAAFVGFLLLIIPGLVLLVRYWVAVPVTVIESPRASDSLRRSEDLTDGNRWNVFAIAVIMGFVVITSSFLLGFAVYAVAGTDVDGRLGAMGQAVITVASIPLNCLGAVPPAVVYHDLRIGKEGADVEELLRVFE